MSNNDDAQGVRVRGLERDEPDLRRLARALIDLAIEQAELTKRDTEATDEASAASTDRGEAA